MLVFNPLSVTPSKMSVKIKKHTDEAVWIRIALGSSFSKPNHLKPTYVVHYLQTPYVFVRNLTSKLKPLLSQVRKKAYSSICACLLTCGRQEHFGFMFGCIV